MSYVLIDVFFSIYNVTNGPITKKHSHLQKIEVHLKERYYNFINLYSNKYYIFILHL